MDSMFCINKIYKTMISYTLAQKNIVKLITGSHFKEKHPAKRKKVIVFDLDETIGHFSHLHMIYKCLIDVFPGTDQPAFNQLLDLYPEFFRPGILTIFDFLFNKKKDTSIFKLYIYTNNQCEESWAKMIADYIQSKVVQPPGAILFDKIINAFKVKNRVVELKRTSNSKSYSDFIKCTMLPEDTVETCFIDNTYYEKMCDSKVYYILPKAYFHSLRKNTMIQRVVGLYHDNQVLKDMLIQKLGENSMRAEVNEVAVTKKIMYLVREFLYYPKFPRVNKTRRHGRVANKKSKRQR